MGVLSIVNCIDNTGVVYVKIIKVFGHSNKRVAKIGDRVVIVISSIKELVYFLIIFIIVFEVNYLMLKKNLC